MKVFIFLLWPFFSMAQTNDTMHKNYTYLALGDSYTIGESLPVQKSFPYQVVQLLRAKGHEFMPPEIVAKTGWTTDELDTAINDHIFLPRYDFVSLLIGVNNQYRGRDIVEYKNGFVELLKKAIAFAAGKTEHVFVVSIPDYGATPFAKNMDIEKISKEIDEYNTLNKAISIQYKVEYIEITESSRKAKKENALVAADGLHPSAKEYSKWAKKIAAAIGKQIKK